MITEDLVVYIQEQLRKNISKELITSRLSKAGWHTDDIEEGLRKVLPPETVAVPQTPTPPLPVLSTPQRQIENQPIEISSPKVVEPLEMPESVPEPVVYIIPGSESSPVVEEHVNPTPVVVAPPINLPTKESAVETNAGEFIPSLIPKAEKSYKSQEVKPIILSNNLPQGALLSSYASDISSAMQNTSVTMVNKRKFPLKLSLFIILLAIIGGTVFASMSGYIDIPALNLPFIKKDPKVLLLSAPNAFKSLTSYKSETHILLTTPKFTNITSGLMTGEAIESKERDSFSVKTEGLVSNEEGSLPSFSHKIIVDSSIIEEDIEADFTHEGDNSFFTISDLTSSLGENAPVKQTVSIKKGQFDILTKILPSSIRTKVSIIDIDKVLYNWVPLYANPETSSVFRDFVVGADVTDKGKEIIKSKETYHYQISPDKASTKAFLSTITQVFLSQTTEISKTDIEDMLGSATLDTFEVWIGKKDNAIHKYKFAISMPLSKIIGLEDKGIAGNVVTLEWESVFYDLNVPNEVAVPADSTPIENFMKSIDDMKVKDVASGFHMGAKSMFSYTGSFGKKVNASGSCVSPSTGSLFSPVGHAKTASGSIGSISSSISRILSLTQNVGYCYSTPTAWAMSFPLPSTPGLYFCADSMGTKGLLTTPLTTTVCK